jgi:hypothetical protein
MTAAQKTAKANFKKAIEYRKKTGVSLKEAFAHVYGKKVGAAPKKKAAKKAATKKAAKKVVKKAAPKKAAKKKHTKYGVVKKHVRRVAGVKKKVSEQSVLNKIHKVKDQVSQLDELQHKHMISGMHKHKRDIIKKLNDAVEMKKDNDFNIILNTQSLKTSIKNKSGKSSLDLQRRIISDQKKYKKEIDTHIKELKKLL